MMRSNILLIVALLFSMVGCDSSINKEYKLERAEKNYQRGMEEYQSGRIDEAIKYLSEAIKLSPVNSSARFQLAVILQEFKKDYLGALCNFTEYIRNAENSDKAQIAKDRKIICEKLLLSVLASENGIGVDKSAVKELEATRSELSKAEKRLAEITAAYEEDSKRLKTLEKENISLSNMIKRLGDVGEEEAASRPRNVANQASNQNKEKASDSTPQSSKLGDKDDESENEKPLTLNPEAKALFEEEEKEAQNLKTTILPPRPNKKPEDKTNAASSPSGFYKKQDKIEKPEFYVVEHGDTLMKIAKKFYGDRTKWRKIRDANKEVVPLSGSVKVGDKLKLP